MKKNAFTMVEIIIVIIIFGIIASIGANIIAKMYMNYIQSRTINYLQTQSGITLEQIAKRLQYRIKDSIIARRTSDDTIYYLGNSNVNETFNVVEWIGYSNEALLTGMTPGWSGFIDLDNTNTNANNLLTPGSNLAAAADIMNILSYETVDLTSDGKEAALIFKKNIKGNEASACFGWDGKGGKDDCITKVQMKDNTNLQISSAPPEIYEHYYLAHSAYAIVPVNLRSNIDFDLELRYNYRPWVDSETFNSTSVSKALLATHVNLFRIKQVGNTIRLKLCLHDNKTSGFDNYIVACKEEVVL
jgi:prepilin-type N-terminal cleavage/methylation domain-containing protein